MAVTLEKIAKIAQTHPSTVSLVLNGRRHDRVSVETRIKIERIANELGYRVNRNAQGLVRGSTRTIALLLNKLSNPYFGQYVSAIESEIETSGYHVMPVETRASTPREIELLSLHRQGVCDLVLSLSHYGTEQDDAIAGQPVVVKLDAWDTASVNKCPVPHTLVDYRPALRKLLTSLEASGRKNLGLVMHGANAPYNDTPVVSDYSRTLRTMLDRSKLHTSAATQVIANENDDLQVWHDLTLVLLKKQPQIDCLLVHTTEFVAPVIEAARKVGRTIGKDLALATFDDPPFAAWINGGVTVIREPIELVAAALAKQSLAVLREQTIPPTQTIEAELIERHSTRPELMAGMQIRSNTST